MRRDAKNAAVLNRRCIKLQSLGFELHHEDSRVNVFGRVMVDFSAISEDNFLEYAIKQVFEEGLKAGESMLQCKLQNLLGVN